jgi:hypothetical protein
LYLSQWLGGSFAFGASSGRVGEPSGQPDLFLLAEVADPAAARVDVAGISRLLPPKTVTPVSIDGFPFLQAVVGDGQSITYGLADGWLYAVSGDAAAVVEAASTSGLEENERYAALRSVLGDDAVNVFVDVQGLRDLSNSLLSDRDRAVYEATAQPLLGPVTFLGGGARSDPNGDIHAHFVLGIQHT